MTRHKDSPVIAVDIGGTKILTALFSGEGRMLDKNVSPTLARQGLDDVVARMSGIIQDLLESHNVSPGAICIAAAGGVDTERGVIVTPSPHLPDWRNAPLAAMFKAKFGVDTWILNDASAAALGEHRFGAGKGVKNLVLFTLGTGIGGGIIIDGRLYLGAVGGAGELGHMTVEAHGLKCDCGNNGCLEMYISGSAIERDARERLSRGQSSLLSTSFQKSENSISAEIVAEVARRGDKLAEEVIARAAFYLGVGFTNIINIFNPEMIIYGGGLAELGDMLIQPAVKLAMERSFSISSGAVHIVKAALGNEAGVYGAAAYVLA